MPVKHIEVSGLGTIAVYKRRDSRALKISIDNNDQIRVSMPNWLPYRVATEFARNKSAWIAQHRKPPTLLKDGQTIGKAHRLEFVVSDRAKTPSTRLVGQAVRVSLPTNMNFTNMHAQLVAKRGATAALRKEASSLLPIRLRQLADQYNFVYSSVRIKQLRSRWGSCSDKRHITLNLFLMNVPWPLIDYVLLHELTHTKHLHHGLDFWTEVETHMPSYKQLRKQLKEFQPSL